MLNEFYVNLVRIKGDEFKVRAREGIYERSMRAALKFQPLAFPKNTRYVNRDEANGRAGIR